MSEIIAAIERHAAVRPDAPALSDGNSALGYADLAEAVETVACVLRPAHPRALALSIENSPAWAVVDLAALRGSAPSVPLPSFFTPVQQAHVLRDSGADLLVTDHPGGHALLLLSAGRAVVERYDCVVAGRRLAFLHLEGGPAAALPAGTAKVTYTSGTTGRPKGVCLGADAMERVAASLAEAARLNRASRHLAALPLATLLENVGGVYATLLAGACDVLPPLAAIGLHGSARFEPGMLLTALWAYEGASVILTPQMLQGLVVALETGLAAPPCLRFVAVGGAPVAPRLLERAEAVGLPVFEGYGLSECASVVALNTRAARRRGSVGKPLPHARVSIAADGEILVSGATLLGYAGDADAAPPEPFPTGDTGRFDADGFLHLTGRKKNMFITSFGRNVAPEWVERELTLHPAIAQAAVFGEARPWNVAIIVPRGSLDPDAIAAAVAEANTQLPDYAQVHAWLLADEPFGFDNGQSTANGRLKRNAILDAYRARIDQLYEEEAHVVP